MSMSKIVLCAALIFAGPALAETDSPPRLYLVQEGIARSTIVLPRDADEWTTKAAQWLQEYVRKASGAELKVVTEDQSPAGTLISVGATKLAADAGISTNDLKWDGCKLIVKRNVLYLIGRDVTKTLAANPWVGAKGTCRAVLMFLEDYCGIRWFTPTPRGIVVPTHTDITVPADLHKVFIPAFAYMDGRSTYDEKILEEPGRTPAAMANNYRKGIIIAPGGNSFHHAVPKAVYFKDHPEYFALIKGQRNGGSDLNPHLCTTNPKVRELLLAYTQKQFDAGWEYVSFGQEDSYQRCECELCEPLDDYRGNPRPGTPFEDFMYDELRNQPPERLFLAAKWVAEQVKKTHPDKKIVLMAYAPTTWPPQKIDYFGDNVVAEVMLPNPDVIEAWAPKVAGMACKTDWFNPGCPMGINPSLTPKEGAERLRYLHKHNVMGITLYPVGSWGLSGPIYYTMGRLMGNPDLDEDKVIDEYCNGLYGAAGSSMHQFFNVIFARVEQVVPLKPTDIYADGRNTRLPRDLTTSVMYRRLYPPSVLDQLEKLLSEAEAKADTDHAKGWVRLTRDYFDFTNLLTRSLFAYEEYKEHPDAASWQQLKRLVNQFDEVRMRIVSYPDSYVADWFPNYDVFCLWMTGNCETDALGSNYRPWPERKEAVMAHGIPRTAVGHGDSYYFSFVKEPLTLDFSKEPTFSQR